MMPSPARIMTALNSVTSTFAPLFFRYFVLYFFILSSPSRRSRHDVRVVFK
jgi:hypothetical protein